jgi:mono/diheme cytochrome c family protein
MKSWMQIATVVSAIALAACGKSAPSGPPLPAAAVAEAETIFAQRCTPCHGAAGAGDGSASASLTPRPRNFHDKSWQQGVTDEHIEKIIAYGGAAVGKSAAMPANPDLTSKTDTVAALRNKIRAFGRQ